jgi:two-component system sensor histidine kinase DegS
MLLTDVQLQMVLVFFVYGLAFFSMGIALTLETGRSPLLAERRVLRPLAVFGLLHGAHEWMEIILLQGVWLGLPFPPVFTWLRVILLTISFVPLVIFGSLMLSAQLHIPSIRFYVVAGLIVIDLAAIALSARIDPENLVAHIDALARYLLATPGGILAGLGLFYRSRQVQLENRPKLAQPFLWAAISIGLYGLTQVFVPSAGIFPTNILNAQNFQSIVGFPIQVLRAAVATLVTVNLIRAIRIVEQEREAQLLSAQQARVEALEQVQKELIQRENLRRQLLRHTVIAQEEERARIARELHDQTAQELTAFTLNLATLRASLPQRYDVAELVARLQSLSHQMSQGIYRMVRDLRPAQLDDLGLVSALKYLVDEGRGQLGLETTLEIHGPRQRLDPLIETVIFRVAQEALTNISRHAQTSQAKMQLFFEPECLTLKICDTGVGFDVHATLSPPRGWGLAGMRERAESLDGEFRLQSVPGQGTAVEVIIPLTQTPAEDIPRDVRLRPELARTNSKDPPGHMSLRN